MSRSIDPCTRIAATNVLAPAYALRKRSAVATTDTELNAMAAAAMSGGPLARGRTALSFLSVMVWPATGSVDPHNQPHAMTTPGLFKPGFCT